MPEGNQCPPGASFHPLQTLSASSNVGLGGFEQKRGSATGSGEQQFGSLLDLHSCLPVQETKVMQVRSLGWEDPLEKEMATHPSTHA